MKLEYFRHVMQEEKNHVIRGRYMAEELAVEGIYRGLITWEHGSLPLQTVLKFEYLKPRSL